jgi:hypothetical protein
LAESSAAENLNAIKSMDEESHPVKSWTGTGDFIFASNPRGCLSAIPPEIRIEPVSIPECPALPQSGRSGFLGIAVLFLIH